MSTVLHHTFVIERRYNHPPAKVFAAFADPAKKRRWMGGESEKHHGPSFVIDSHTCDFRIEGVERWRFHTADRMMTNDTFYLDIEKDRRIVFAYTMTANDVRFSSSHTTVELIPDGDGTKLIFTEQGAYFDGKQQSATDRESGSRQLVEALGRDLDRNA